MYRFNLKVNYDENFYFAAVHLHISFRMEYFSNLTNVQIALLLPADFQVLTSINHLLERITFLPQRFTLKFILCSKQKIPFVVLNKKKKS